MLDRSWRSCSGFIKHDVIKLYLVSLHRCGEEALRGFTLFIVVIIIHTKYRIYGTKQGKTQLALIIILLYY